MSNKRGKSGNFFARELEDILLAHQQSLRTLEPRLGIAEEKARRLQQSLYIPGSFPVLDPSELKQLVLELKLDDSEWMRLRAALLTTEVQRMLTYRIGAEQAARVAQNIAPLMIVAAREWWLQTERDGTERGPDREPLRNTEGDQAWDGVWETLDSATLALQLSLDVSSEQEYTKKLWEAATDFQHTLDQLDEQDEGMKHLPLWTNAYQEAKRGLDMAVERLDDLSDS